MSRRTGKDHKSGGTMSSLSIKGVQAMPRVFHTHHGLGVLCVPQTDVSVSIDVSMYVSMFVLCTCLNV